MISVSAVNPCFRELRRERAFPPWLLGPVLFLAFVLFVCSCFFDAIFHPRKTSVLFTQLT